MIFTIVDEGRIDSGIPPEWKPFIRTEAGTVTVEGHPTAETNVFLTSGDNWCVVATEPHELVAEMHRRSAPIRISPFGLSSLLHNGLIPVPQTVYEGVFHLAMGDVATVSMESGRVGLSLGHRYPWVPDESTEDNPPDTRHLLDLLTEATADRVAEAGSGVLMLSSGKDSSSVALAVAEAGLADRVTTITYRTGPDDPEPPVAADIAGRLGLRHEAIDLPEAGPPSTDALLRFFETNAIPGTDLSQIPYIFALAALDAAGATALDGGGNDPYMGYPPKGRDKAKLRYRLRGRHLGRLAQRLTPVDSPVNYAARSATEASLPGRTPRMHHIKSLYPDSVDVQSWWYDLDRAIRPIDPMRLYAEINERHTHPTQTVMKQRLAAHAVGMTSSLPWADRTIADYYFNLPVDHRYDVVGGDNKVLLRRLLLEYLDYDANAIGKHFFLFDGPRFVVENRDFIWSEIEASPLWDPSGLPMVRAWLDRVDDRPMHYHAVLTVFMVSGWSNHGPHRMNWDSGRSSTAQRS